MQTNDEELERDLEHWFRGAFLLLVATANLEGYFFEWVPWHRDWPTTGLRLLLAVGVIESMPDEDLFPLVHRGPPKIRLTAAGLAEAWRRRKAVIKGLGVLHLKRSSPVFVIMCVVFGGPPGTANFAVGWWCYGLALVQYLIIALVTDRRRAAGLLAAIDPDHQESAGHADRVRGAAGSSGAFAEHD